MGMASDPGLRGDEHLLARLRALLHVVDAPPDAHAVRAHSAFTIAMLERAAAGDPPSGLGSSPHRVAPAVRVSPTMVQPRCQTIDDVIARMTELERTLSPVPGPGYGAFCFNRLYLGVTQQMRQAVAQPGFFADPARLAQLDVIFAQLYFDAVDAVAAGQPAKAAWQVLFDHSTDAGILPIQFAIAGMNAHINHDLPIALVALWTADGERAHIGDAAYGDYTRVNEVLRTEEARERAMIEPEVLQELDRGDGGTVGRLDGRLAMWTVEAARAAAWETADCLWEVRHVPPAEHAVLDTVDRVVAVWGDAFLAPL